MEGQSGFGHPDGTDLQLMSTNFGGGGINDVVYGTADYYSDNFSAFHELNENYQSANYAPPLSQWFHTPTPPQNYFGFINENSTFGQAPPPPDMLGTLPPLPSCSHFAQELPPFHGELELACGSSKIADQFLPVMDPCKPELCSYTFHNEMSHEIPPTQNHDSWAQEQRCGGIGCASQTHPKVSVAASVLLSKPQRTSTAVKQITASGKQVTAKTKRSRAYEAEQKRKLRIDGELKALEELIPHSVKGTQETVIDETIDHIKNLQFQMKKLCQGRLLGGPTSGPFVLFEGYGHYIVNEKMNEPLEEIMGKLLEANPADAIKLLKSRGLFVMPMSLADST